MIGSTDLQLRYLVGNGLQQNLEQLFPLICRDGIECGADVGSGWWPTVAWACAKLERLARQQKISDYVKEPLRLAQVKEKFGTLHINISQVVPADSWMCEAARDIIVSAEQQTTNTCEYCGGFGWLREDLMWIKTLCEADYKKWKSGWRPWRDDEEE